jgi:hypothetical protein
MTDIVEPTKKKPAIDLVKKHFQGRIAGALNKYHVEQWGFDVYYRTITSLRQEAKIVELSTQGKTVEALVEGILSKALGEDGKPLFHMADKSVLMNEADPQVILDLSRVLNGSDLPSVEDAEKN